MSGSVILLLPSRLAWSSPPPEKRSSRSGASAPFPLIFITSGSALTQTVNAQYQEKRREERVRANLPVNVGVTTGITRDVSATGMYFETDASYAVGSTVSVALDIDTPQGRMLFKCRGEILRIERQGKKVGVAVRFIESTLAPPEV